MMLFILRGILFLGMILTVSFGLTVRYLNDEHCTVGCTPHLLAKGTAIAGGYTHSQQIFIHTGEDILISARRLSFSLLVCPAKAASAGRRMGNSW